MIHTNQAQNFDRQLKTIAADLALMYVASDGHYWVVQKRAQAGLVLPDGGLASDFAKIIPIKTPTGQFRLPEARDLAATARCVKVGHERWDRGGDWLIDQIELEDAHRQADSRARRHDRLEYLTRHTASLRRGGQTTNLGAI